MIHNCLLDLGASHNLMPKAVMEALGLSITQPYHDMYAFDSRVVKCLDVIKEMVVNFAQLPMKSVIMDVVVADITPKFGLLLSRSWEKKVGGTLQMDLTYATIPVFGGENRRMYRELQFSYIVTDDKNPTNHPLYVIDKDLGTCMLHFSDDDNIAGLLQLKRNSQLNAVRNKKMSFGNYTLMDLLAKKVLEQGFLLYPPEVKQ